MGGFEVLGPLIAEMRARVEAGADIPEIERLTTEIDFLARQQAVPGLELEVCADGRQRLVVGDGFSRAGWRTKADASTCEKDKPWVR